MNDWIAFWDSEHAIYVNAHHRDVHYRRVAEDIARYVPKNGAVLDYGCGEALHADIVAASAKQLILCEAAPKVREGLVQRFAGNPKILVASPEQVGALENKSLDLVVLHSVAQYLTREQFGDLLMLFHGLLSDDGVLVIGDIIPTDVSAAHDASALLQFAREEGFFFAAFLGLARTLFSNYWDLRSKLGLTRYDRDDVLRMLTHAGFWASSAEHNIGHNQARKTYLGRMRPVHD